MTETFALRSRTPHPLVVFVSEKLTSMNIISWSILVIEEKVGIEFYEDLSGNVVFIKPQTIQQVIRDFFDEIKNKNGIEEYGVEVVIANKPNRKFSLVACELPQVSTVCYTNIYQQLK